MNSGDLAPFYHYIEIIVHLPRACYVPRTNFTWPLGGVVIPILQVKKLKLKEEEEAELGCELLPVSGLAHTLHGTGAVLSRLVESKQWGISRGG